MSSLFSALTDGSPWRLLKRLASPWRTSPAVTIAGVAVTVAVTVFAAVAQNTDPGWHLVGHSIAVWGCLALLVATRGHFIQAASSTVLLLCAAVIAYYVSEMIASPFVLNYGTLVGRLIFWLLAAIVAGIVLPAIVLVGFRQSVAGGVSIGVVIGILAGDLINASAGAAIVDNPDVIGSIGAISVAQPLPLIVIAALAVYVAAMVSHHRRGLVYLLWSPVGVVVGYVLVSLPDYLLH